MKQDEYLLCDETETRWIPADTAELPKGSHGDEFASLLKLTGIMAVIVALACVIAYFDAGS